MYILSEKQAKRLQGRRNPDQVCLSLTSQARKEAYFQQQEKVHERPLWSSGTFYQGQTPNKNWSLKKKKKKTDPTHEYSQVPLTKPLSELSYNYFLLLQRLLIRKISSRNKNLELPPCIPLIPELSRPLLHFNASQFFATAPLYSLSLIRHSTARLNKISEQAFAMSPQKQPPAWGLRSWYKGSKAPGAC